MDFCRNYLSNLKDAILNMPEKRKLIILSFVVGISSGLAAVILESLVRAIHRGLTSWFDGSLDNFLYLVYPGIGMLLSLILLRFVIKDNIGHGVTKVLVAVSKNDSRIKPHNMWSSILTSSLTIGFGIFKAPLAGVLFTLEILLFNISMTSMMPLLFSTVSATMVSYIFLGDALPFECTLTPFRIVNVPFYVLLGFFCGLCSLYFLRTTLWLEDKLGKVKNPYAKWAFCAGGLGLLIFLFPPLYGEGYDALGPLLNGQAISYDGDTILAFMLHRPWLVPVFFALILILKVFSMTLTNAGGGVGGTFGPTLFVGAMAGFLLARVTNLLLAGTEFTVPEQNFVLVGMAGLMAGVMQAPMTAIFLIAEISGGYELFIPLIITASIAFGTIRIFEKYSIYTKRIAKSGDLLTHDSDQAVLTLLKVTDLVERGFSPVQIDATLGELVHVISCSSRNIFPVIDSNRHFQGYVSLEDVRKDMFRPELYTKMHVFNYMKSSPAYVYEDEKMDSVMNKFESTDAWNLPVVKKDRTYIGFVSKSKIFSAYRDELKELSQD